MSVQRLDRASAVLGLFVIVVEAVQLACGWSRRRRWPRCCWTSPPTKPMTLVCLPAARRRARFPAASRGPCGRAVRRRPARLSRASLASLLDRPLLSADLLYLDAWHEVEPTGQMALSSALVLLAWRSPSSCRRAPARSRIGARCPGLRPRVRQPGRAPLRGRLASPTCRPQPRWWSPPCRSRWPPLSPCCCTARTCRSPARCRAQGTAGAAAATAPRLGAGGAAVRRLAGGPGGARGLVRPGLRTGPARSAAHRRHGGRRRARRPDGRAG